MKPFTLERWEAGQLLKLDQWLLHPHVRDMTHRGDSIDGTSLNVGCLLLGRPLWRCYSERAIDDALLRLREQA